MFVFTGKQHPSLYGVMVMYERYNARASGFLLGYSETYAPFDFDTTNRGRQRLPAGEVGAPRSTRVGATKGGAQRPVGHSPLHRDDGLFLRGGCGGAGRMVCRVAHRFVARGNPRLPGPGQQLLLPGLDLRHDGGERVPRVSVCPPREGSFISHSYRT